MTSLEYSDAALKILTERYLQPGEKPDDMWRRVADTIANRDDHGEEYAEFYDMLRNREFIPGSPLLSNAGKKEMCYSSCFVLPVNDSMKDIMATLGNAALVHKAGGGTGFSFSRLRPANAKVSTTNNGIASGPVSFMRLYDQMTETVKQGGTRRGANMGILRVDHPDIMEFINCKLDGTITNFNISVGITDAFMKALAEDGLYSLRFNGERYGDVSAREVWNGMIKAAWRTGDPGMVFLDRINAGSANPVPSLGPVEATNPCGEQPLYDNDVCNLGSINLGKFVKNGEVDWESLVHVTRRAVRFLDNVIDKNYYPLPEIDKMAKEVRRIGLGVMGWHDMLMRLKVPYASDEALRIAETVMGGITETGTLESQVLAKERGAFTLFDQSIWAKANCQPMRNSTITTIAPTGTISLIADASSGIEPLFALSYTHNNQQGRVMTVTNQTVLELAEEGVTPQTHPDLFKTAQEIDPIWHLRHQAAFQKNTHNAVSKTINLPNSALEADIAMIYQMAWDTGCMGITVFRDGCKGTQVLNVTKPLVPGFTLVPGSHASPARVATDLIDKIKDRPKRLHGYTETIQAPEGTVNITVNSDDGGPLEVFVNIGRAGSDTNALAEALGRLISLNLRLPSPMSQTERTGLVAAQLRGLGGSRQIGFGPKAVKSLPDAIAKVLASDAQHKTADLCPDCGNATLVHEEGCKKCAGCGYSAC